MKHIFSACALAVLLAACAGGGGGDGAGTAQTPDGTKIDLTFSDYGWVGGKTNGGQLQGFNSPSSFYGIWTSDGSRVREVRYQGTQTRDMPTSGKATYVGNAIRYDSVTGDILRVDDATMLNVDFGGKTVNGKIEMPGLRRDITLNTGRISGASYSGSASVTGNSGGRYEGGFFGDNAKETAGFVKFDNNADLNTAFGGKRY
jgi:hypothetical protein